MTDIYAIPHSAAHEWPDTRARRIAWERYGNTPLHDALAAHYGLPVLLDDGAA